MNAIPKLAFIHGSVVTEMILAFVKVITIAFSTESTGGETIRADTSD